MEDSLELAFSGKLVSSLPCAPGMAALDMDSQHVSRNPA